MAESKVDHSSKRPPLRMTCVGDRNRLRDDGSGTPTANFSSGSGHIGVGPRNGGTEMLGSWTKRVPTTQRKGRRRLVLLSAVVAVSVIAATSTAMARHATGSEHKVRSTHGSAVILGLTGNPRVSSIDLKGSAVVVSGAATGPGADATRTLWYETVAGAAYAEQTGAKSLTRNVVDASGNVLTTETDPVEAGTPDALAPSARSAADIARAAQERASALGATVVETNYIPLFGGTSELVIQPSDPASFLETSGENVSALLGPLAHDAGAYLVTIVDAKQVPLLVLGFTPGVGAGAGQGLGWQAPDVHSDAIWGAPVTDVTP